MIRRSAQPPLRDVACDKAASDAVSQPMQSLPRRQSRTQEIASCFLAASSYEPNIVARDALSLNAGLMRMQREPKLTDYDSLQLAFNLATPAWFPQDRRDPESELTRNELASQGPAGRNYESWGRLQICTFQ